MERTEGRREKRVCSDCGAREEEEERREGRERRGKVGAESTCRCFLWRVCTYAVSRYEYIRTDTVIQRSTGYFLLKDTRVEDVYTYGRFREQRRYFYRRGLR